MHFASIICPMGRGIWLLFHRKFINCSLKYCEIWKQGQFKHERLLRFLRIDRKLEIAQNAKSCSKRKKLLEIPEVAKKLWKALYYFHQQNNEKRIKGNEDQDICFCSGSEKSRFEWLHKEPFKNFSCTFRKRKN